MKLVSVISAARPSGARRIRPVVEALAEAEPDDYTTVQVALGQQLVAIRRMAVTWERSGSQVGVADVYLETVELTAVCRVDRWLPSALVDRFPALAEAAGWLAAVKATDLPYAALVSMSRGKLTVTARGERLPAYGARLRIEPDQLVYADVELADPAAEPDGWTEAAACALLFALGWKP